MKTAAFETLGRDIPGPQPMPVLGWLPLLFRFALDPLASLEDMRKQYGNILRLGIKKYPVIMVFHPEYNRQILRDPVQEIRSHFAQRVNPGNKRVGKVGRRFHATEVDTQRLGLFDLFGRESYRAP